jgi:hypothetical protein
VLQRHAAGTARRRKGHGIGIRTTGTPGVMMMMMMMMMVVVVVHKLADPEGTH